MSLEEVFKLFYFLGLTSIQSWEMCMKSVKTELINVDNIEVITLYMRLSEVVKRIKIALEIKLDVNSQDKIVQLNNYLFDIEEIYDNIINTIPNFNEKNIIKSTFVILNNLIKNYLDFNMKNVYVGNDIDIDIDHNDDDDDNDDNDDDGDDERELEKIFTSVRKSKSERKSSLFEQFVMFQSNGTRKTLKTPGETGRYLLKIEIIDTKDLKGIEVKDRWTKAAYRTTFLVGSEKDPKYIQLYKMVLNVAKHLSTIQNVKKNKFKNF